MLYFYYQALADLEQRWHTEVLDRKEDKTIETPPFFHDFHLQEVHFVIFDSTLLKHYLNF